LACSTPSRRPSRITPEQRRQQRELQSKPIAEALAAWAAHTVPQLSRKSELAQAFRYMRARWTALVRCFGDGRLALDNNPAERALRFVAIAGRIICSLALMPAAAAPLRSIR
jgi:LPS sulfotransferase NodH